MPTGTTLVKEPEATSRAVALYARVSSADEKADLDRQIARLVAYASEQGWAVTRAISEIRSGLSDRPRLMRFGFEYVEAALAAQGRRIVVVESGEVKDDLVQDMIEVLTSFCARLYGRRSAQALEAIEREG